MQKSNVHPRQKVHDWIRHFIVAWLIAGIVEFMLVPGFVKSPTDLYTIAQMSLIRMLCITVGISVVLHYLSRFSSFQKAERWMLPGCLFVLTFFSLKSMWSLPMAIFCAVVLTISIFYALRGWNRTPYPSAVTRQADKRYFHLTLWVSICVFLFLSIWSVCEYLSFSLYTFDFGIFAQMFHSMKTTGLPITTLERDWVLSHFGVHVSPIYYLMLPIYWLIPSPLTLQVLQALVVVSAAIPMWKLTGHHGLNGLHRFLLCAILLLTPAIVCGTRDGLHENCFLTVLILWLFYGIDAKKIPTLTIAALLTLLVKEDAPVYVAVIGLWQLVCGILHKKRWSIIVGSSLLVGAVLYFLGVTSYLALHGDGVMTYRYQNLMVSGDGSLLSVIKCVLLSPMKAIYECATAAKISYIAKTLLPLLALPFLTRRYEHYILLIPYVLINLLPDYSYQQNIYYQYNFGSLAFLLYLTILVLAEWKLDCRRTIALIASLAVTATLFCFSGMQNGIKCTITYLQNRETFKQIEQILNTVPEDASVCAASRFTPHLASRDTLYDTDLGSAEHLLSCEYVIVDIKKAPNTELIKQLLDNGYQEIGQIEGQLIIYQQL